MNDRFTLAVTGQSLIKHDIRDIPAPAFRELQSLLRQADLSFTNFEGTILGRHGGWPLKGSFFGCSDPVVLDTLRAIGFRALSPRTTMLSTSARPACFRRSRKWRSEASCMPASAAIKRKSRGRAPQRSAGGGSRSSQWTEAPVRISCMLPMATTTDQHARASTGCGSPRYSKSTELPSNRLGHSRQDRLYGDRSHQ